MSVKIGQHVPYGGQVATMGEVDCGLLSHCGSPGHSVASHSGPPGRGMASLVAPSNETDLINNRLSLTVEKVAVCVRLMLVIITPYTPYNSYKALLQLNLIL